MCPRVSIFAALSLALALVSCGDHRDTRPWAPADHDRADDSPERRPQSSPAGSGSAGSRGALAMVVDVAWQKNCATCHGAEGRGDGPSGPMVKATDLTRPQWQASVDDAAIANVIRAGKNRMPKFDLPPEIVDGLVGRIRARRAR